MGVGKAMKIFMEGMQNSMVSSGYTGKIVNTPMGPFKWDETTNSWVNQNNGFSIPNISLQDLMMYDYGTISDETISSGGSQLIIDPCIYTLPVFTPSSENAGRVPVSTTQSIALTAQILTNITCPVNINYVRTPGNTGRLADYTLLYSINEGVTKSKLSNIIGVNVSAGYFRLYIARGPTVVLGLPISIDIINVSDNNAVLTTIEADFGVGPVEEYLPEV
jgi:hypothetical protein